MAVCGRENWAGEELAWTRSLVPLPLETGDTAADMDVTAAADGGDSAWRARCRIWEQTETEKNYQLKKFHAFQTHLPQVI